MWTELEEEEKKQKNFIGKGFRRWRNCNGNVGQPVQNASAAASMLTCMMRWWRWGGRLELLQHSALTQRGCKFPQCIHKPRVHPHVNSPPTTLPPLITFSSLTTRIRSAQGWRRPCSSQLNTLFDNCEEKKDGCRSGDQLQLTHTHARLWGAVNNDWTRVCWQISAKKKKKEKNRLCN